MRYILRIILLGILGLLGFGLYKHDFNFDAYISYLSVDAGENIATKFSISDPSTRHVMLYDSTQNTNEQDALLEQQLQKLNELAQFGSGTLTTGDVLGTGQEIIFSGENLSGLDLSGTLMSGGGITGESDMFSGFDFGEVEALFDFESTGKDTATGTLQTTGQTTGAVTTGTTATEKIIATENDTLLEDIETLPPEDTGTGTGTEVTPTKALSPLLQKRLDQYKKYKETLAE